MLALRPVVPRWRCLPLAALAAQVAFAPSPARGEPKASDTELPKLTVGRDLIRTAPAAAMLDGAWSASLQFASLLTSNRFRGAQPRGFLAHEATRVLYGTSWTAMLAAESFAVAAAGGGSFDF